MTSNYKNKSELYLDAADTLISNQRGQYAVVPHSAYYSCLLYMEHVCYVVNGKTEKEIRPIINKKQIDLHVGLSNYIKKELGKSFIVIVVATWISSSKIFAGIVAVSLFLFALPVAERFVRPFVNSTIVEAFNWVFKKKNRKELQDRLIETYEKENPKPILFISKIEDYI